MIENVLHYADEHERIRLCVPKVLLPQIIREIHEGSPLGSHLGARKTYETLQRTYHARSLWSSTLKFVQSCRLCASTNTRAQRIPIQDIEIPNHPFETVALDVCGPFPPSSNGHRYVITLIDMLTNYVEATTSPDKSAASIASFIVDEIIPRHSVFRTLITDNGGENVNDIMFC